MLVTIVTVHQGRTQVHQIEAPTVKDCLVAWAGRIQVEGLTDEQQTRLRGEMADFDKPPMTGFRKVWRLQTRIGPSDEEATLVVVETVRS